MNNEHTFPEQGSDEWLQERAGKQTASRFHDVTALSKAGKPLQARQDYMLQLVFERTAGAPKQSINSRSLEWGAEVEAFAREAYELETGNLVTSVGFLAHPAHDFIGGSPDGLVGNDGLIEIKCPHDEKVHVRTWLEGMPEAHRAQIQGNLFVTGRHWADFISYDPRQAEHLRLYVQRIERDQDYIDSLEKKLLQFEAELQQMIKTLEKKAA